MVGSLPIESSLDELASLVSGAAAEPEYLKRARLRGLAILSGGVLAGAVVRYLVATFSEGTMLRVHVASLWDPPLDDFPFGILVTERRSELVETYDRLRDVLARRWGEPELTSEWESTSIADECGYTYRLARWDLGDTSLVLLHNDEGDAHIGEWETVDVRVVPKQSDGSLWPRTREPLGWPVEL